MSDWETLGIGPTRDPTELKRAYNRKLREHPPEKDPVGFMQLRAAYERLQEELERQESIRAESEDVLGSDDEDEERGEDDVASRCGDNFRHPSPPPLDGTFRGPPPSSGSGTGSGGLRWNRVTPWESNPPPLRGPAPGSGFGRRPDQGIGSFNLDKNRLQGFRLQPESFGGESYGDPPTPPASRGFSPGSAKDVTSPGDHEVNPLWLAFRELWNTRRDEPAFAAWQDLIDLLEMDRTLRRLFSPRLARFLEECFVTGIWHDASEVLLWRLAVVLQWDRDPSPTEEIVGRSIGSTLEAWRTAAAVDSLSRRFRILSEELGWEQSKAWEEFFELVCSEPRWRRAFEPVGRELLAIEVRRDRSGRNPAWIERMLDDLSYLNSLKPKSAPTSIDPSKPPPPVHIGPLPVENLQSQDRSMLWGIAAIVLVFVAFLAYQIGKRILGG